MRDSSGRLVAVKKTVISQQKKRRIEVFKRELRALSRMSHQNVIGMYGAGIDPCGPEFIFVILEKCDMDGWSYVNNIFQPSFIEKFDKGILEAWADLAEGCSHMASKGILHRDLTLDNILVSNSQAKPCFKVSDFGVSGVAADFN